MGKKMRVGARMRRERGMEWGFGRQSEMVRRFSKLERISRLVLGTG